MEGLIFKALGGFYYVRTPAGDLSCRGRGLLRREEVPPMVGDRVTVEPTEPGYGTVVDILPRKNWLLRPSVANLDRLVLVVSCAEPVPNVLILDKLTAIACRRSIPVVLVFSKIDLPVPRELVAVYRQAGFSVWEVNSLTGEGVSPLRDALQQGVSVFCGNSGVGKSSLLNALFPALTLATGEISKKLGRGKHTTRHVELYDTGHGGYIADTPGFSAVEFLQLERMAFQELECCFPEFSPYLQQCRYTGCSHTAERDCAIRAAVAAGEIPTSRYQSYCAIYDELKQVKEWEL
ncbi:MAG: ribosome small subunit-dependent GTPase A [Angelakisella sp.]